MLAVKKKVKVFVSLAALKGRIREKGTSYRKLSEILGIATATFSQKINGFSCFGGNEINCLIDELEIPENEIAIYFFPRKFRKETNKGKNNIKIS